MSLMSELVDKLPVARPLRVLVPLIKEDLKNGDEAAKTAGMAYYIAAGEKLIEARTQFNADEKILYPKEFASWVRRNFPISRSTALKYIELAGNDLARNYPSMNRFHRATNNRAFMPNKPRPQPWHDPVRDALAGVDVKAMRQANLKQAEERDLQRKLALQLIDIGYKALATKLHSDKGGSDEAMTRLNTVRGRLKRCVE